MFANDTGCLYEIPAASHFINFFFIKKNYQAVCFNIALYCYQIQRSMSLFDLNSPTPLLSYCRAVLFLIMYSSR